MRDIIIPWGAGGGLTLGLLFGVLAQRSRFCVVAALSNLWLMHDRRHINAWLSALAVALLGTTALERLDLVSIADSSYRRPSVDRPALLGGGLVLGYGAILAGGCATRTLIRVREGNLGALITLLTFALAGMATGSAASLLAFGAMVVGMVVGLWRIR